MILQVQRFLGPGVKVQHAYSDKAKEIIKAMEDMGIVHDTSTPHRSETNGVIERNVPFDALRKALQPVLYNQVSMKSGGTKLLSVIVSYAILLIY